MALELHHGEDINRVSQSVAIKFLYAKWKTLASLKRVSLPELTERSNYDIPANSTYMVTSGNDFIYTHIGPRVREALGRDFTGQAISTLPDSVAVELAEAYRTIVSYGAPAYIRFTSVSENVLLWERLIIPIPAGAGATFLLCYSDIISHQREVYEYVFKHSPMPMLVIYPIASPSSPIDDGWIVLVNDMGRELLDVHGPIGNRRVRELAPFQFPEFWSDCRAGFASANAMVEIPSAPFRETFRCVIVKLNHLAIVRFVPRELHARVPV
jgi:hypothetical protein